MSACGESLFINAVAAHFIAFGAVGMLAGFDFIPKLAQAMFVVFYRLERG